MITCTASELAPGDIFRVKRKFTFTPRSLNMAIAVVHHGGSLAVTILHSNAATTNFFTWHLMGTQSVEKL